MEREKLNVYWQFCEEFPSHFISLEGDIIRIDGGNGKEMYRLNEGFVDEKSRENLAKLFLENGETERDNLSQLQELWQSFNQQAKRHLDCDGMQMERRLFGCIEQEPIQIGDREYKRWIERIELAVVEELEMMINALKGVELKDLTEDLDIRVLLPDSIEVCDALLSESIEIEDPRTKMQKLAEIHAKVTHSRSEPLNADTLIPLLTFSLLKMHQGHLVLAEMLAIEASGIKVSGAEQYILTNFSAAAEVIKQIYRRKLQIVDCREEASSEKRGHFANLLASIAQVPKSLASTFTTTLKSPIAANTRPPPPKELLTSENREIDGFRERILAVNSANDLTIRDVNLMLEDYKNLLYVLFK